MRYFLPLFLAFSLFGSPKICVVPDYYGYVHTMFPEEPLDDYGNLGVWGKIKYRLKEYGYEIRGSDLSEYAHGKNKILAVTNEQSGTVEKIVFLNVPRFIDLQSLSGYPEGTLHLIVFEPPSVDAYLHTDAYYRYFHKVLTWDDDRIDGDKFVKFFYPVMYPMKKELVPFSRRKLCSLIARNKTSSYRDELYSERLKAVIYFEKKLKDGFDLFGYGWEKLPFKTYRGSVEDKYKVLKNYKFSICYENTHRIKGYITEKIFDCFHCGVVPIYLGASNVTEYIPPECFIDKRDFPSYDALYEYISTMNQEEHDTYLKSIRSFLATEEAKRFSDEYFVETFLREIVGISHMN